MNMMSARVKASMPGMLNCRHANIWHAWAHILAQQGQIREIQVSMVRGDMPVMSIILYTCNHACMLSSMYSFFLSHAWAHIPDKGALIEDQGFYGMRRACESCLSSEDDTSTPASMHACYIFAYTCKNVSQIGSDQRDHGIYLGDHAGQFGAPK